MNSPRATVCVITRNRWAAAAAAVRSALAQRPWVPVRVIDDASDDGTAERLRAMYPGVTVDRNEHRLGLLPNRNRCLRESRTPLVFFLDDDARFLDAATVQQTADDFTPPRVAVVAIPYYEHGRLKQRQYSRSEPAVVQAFVAAVHACRREALLRAGGYRERLGFYTEESDLAIRLLERGLVVRGGSAAPAVHEPHPDRDPDQRIVQRWRNEFAFKWAHTPIPWLAPVLLGHWANVLAGSIRRRRPELAARVLRGAADDAWRFGRERAPVRVATYRRWRALARGPGRLDELEPALPCAVAGAIGTPPGRDAQAGSSNRSRARRLAASSPASAGGADGSGAG